MFSVCLTSFLLGNASCLEPLVMSMYMCKEACRTKQSQTWPVPKPDTSTEAPNLRSSWPTVKVAYYEQQ